MRSSLLCLALASKREVSSWSLSRRKIYRLYSSSLSDYTFTTYTNSIISLFDWTIQFSCSTFSVILPRSIAAESVSYPQSLSFVWNRESHCYFSALTCPVRCALFFSSCLSEYSMICKERKQARKVKSTSSFCTIQRGYCEHKLMFHPASHLFVCLSLLFTADSRFQRIIVMIVNQRLPDWNTAKMSRERQR